MSECDCAAFGPAPCDLAPERGRVHVGPGCPDCTETAWHWHDADDRAPDPACACACSTLRPGESCPAHPFDPTQYLPGGPIAAGNSRFSEADRDRQHRASPDCWCGPVERDGGWWHSDGPTP